MFVLGVFLVYHLVFVNSFDQTGVEKEQFLWGVATAAYQIEGSTDSFGRGPSIWDTFSKIPNKIANNENGDIADAAYGQVKEDVQLVKSMGLTSYRFSISWSRILPMGAGEVNHEGINHYNFLIDELIKEEIEPLVTLYHWDLPQALEDKYEGWLNAKIEQDFAHYADVCFANFGDRVKKWATLNEPWTVCLQGYMTGAFAPGRCSDRSKCNFGDSSQEGYIAGHNMLNAHAAAVEVYREKYQKDQGGLIGIVLNHDWGQPLTDTSDDIIAAERRNEFAMGWFMDPLVFGKYPDSMVANVGDRLPTFTQKQRQRLMYSFDYLGLNHYSSKYISNNSTSMVVKESMGWGDDQRTIESKYDTAGVIIGEEAESSWLQVVPWGFYNVIMWTRRRYGGLRGGRGPLIYITENGCDAPGEQDMAIEQAVHDEFRINYYRQYLAQLDRAIGDGADIVGYYAWSLMDNFEWVDGYSKRFGLYYVDYKDPARPRTPKDSVAWYSGYAAEHATTYKGRTAWGGDQDGVLSTADIQYDMNSNRGHSEGDSADVTATATAHSFIDYLSGAIETAVNCAVSHGVVESY